MSARALATLARSASTSPECEWCCLATTYTASLAPGLSLPVFTSATGTLSLISVCWLLWRLSTLYRSSIERGYAFSSRPILAIRASRAVEKETVWILPWYFSYVIANTVYMVMGLFVSFLEPSLLTLWIGRFLCGLCDFFDLWLFVFLCLPRITPRAKLLCFVVTGLIGVGVSVFVTLVGQERPCPWCSQHYPISAVSWIYLAQAIVMAIAVVWAKVRPFRENNPRPAVVFYACYWIPLYVACGVVLPIMDANYGVTSVDWGFCVLGVVVVVYYALLVPVFYVTITRDSKYVLMHSLDSALADEGNNVQFEEDARYLLQQHEQSNEELVDVLGDASVSLVKAEELDLVRRVGVGGYGEVFEGWWCGTHVAVKKLLASALAPENKAGAQSSFRGFVKEIQMLARLRHPNILLLVGFCIDQGSQAIISEFCTLGSVWDAIHSPERQGDLTRERKMSIVLQVAAAMSYLHKSGIVHRDLKSPNILLTGAWQARVADFGLSRLLSPSTDPSTAALGTVAWSAPELLASSQDHFGPPVDVFAFGVVLYELGSLKAPYNGMAPMVVAIGVLQRQLTLSAADFRPDAPPVVAALLPQCTAFEPEERPSFDEVVKSLQQQHI